MHDCAINEKMAVIVQRFSCNRYWIHAVRCLESRQSGAQFMSKIHDGWTLAALSMLIAARMHLYCRCF